MATRDPSQTSMEAEEGIFLDHVLSFKKEATSAFHVCGGRKYTVLPEVPDTPHTILVHAPKNWVRGRLVHVEAGLVWGVGIRSRT